MAAGTQLDVLMYVNTKPQQKAEEVQPLVDTMVTLLLASPTSFLLLRATLTVRVQHCAVRCA